MRKRRLLCLIFSMVMAVGLICPAQMGSVKAEEAGAGFSVTSADSDMIVVKSEGVDRIYVETQIGNKKPAVEMYKFKTGDGEKTANIDLSYLKGKDAVVKVYSRKAPKSVVTIKVSAQPKKLKGKFNAKTGEMAVTLGGGNVKSEDVNCRIGRKVKNLTECNFENYYVKGATLYLSTKKTEKKENIAVGTTASFTPASKEAKVKIPARPKGPSAVINPDLLSITLARGSVIRVTGKDGKVVSEAATANKTLDVKEFVSRAGIKIDDPNEPGRSTSSTAAILEVYKEATETKLESKVTEVKVPWQPIFDESLIGGSNGVTYSAIYNSGKTKQTGIKVNNKTNEILHVAILPGDKTVADINLIETDSAKKLVWYEVKPGRMRDITGDKVVSGAQLVYRVRGVVATSTKKLQLASTIVADPVRIKVVNTAKNETGLISVSPTAPDGSYDKSASYTALKINPVSAGVKYAYTVRDRSLTGVKIGYKLGDLKEYGTIVTEGVASDGTAMHVKITANQWIVVFVMDAEDNVIAYGSRQVTKSDMY